MKHHLIISGTGRTGTTFLVQLLTALKRDTGFASPSADIAPNCHAGMEWDLRHPDAPYIVKSPWLCDYLDEVLETGTVVIDHAIIPVRNLYAAAESRRDVARRSDKAQYPDGVPGGLWHTEKFAEQETILATQLHKIIETIARHDIPLTLLHFPRLVKDPEYLFGKIRFALGGIGYEQFLDTFRAVVRPDIVHEFHAGETAR